VYNTLTHIKNQISPKFLTVVILLCSLFSLAQVKYWVGGTGEWNDTQHWAYTSGGEGGAEIPNLQDSVIINDLSSVDEFSINFSGKIFSKTILVETNKKVNFLSNINSKIYISQTFNFPKNVFNQIKGKVTVLNTHSTKIPQKFGINEFVNVLNPPSFSIKNQLKPLALDITINVSDVSCHSAKDGEIELIVNNGTGPFTYDWFPNSPPLNGDGTNKVTQLDPGLYNVIVTDLFDDTEEILVDISVTTPSPITVSRLNSSKNVTCPGGNDGRLNTSVFGGQGPYTYSWNTAPVQTTQNALNLIAGNYQLTVTDATGCVANSQIFTVTQPPAFQANFTNIITVDCNGNCNGEATAAVTGGTPGYTYLWYDAANENTPNASNLCARTYNVRVTDSRGCVDTVEFIMTEPDVLTLPYDSTNVTCFELDNGTITINPLGGTAPYNYNWLNTPNPETASFVDSLPPGTYNVLVTDFRGCTESTQVNISEPNVLDISITSSVNVLCFGECTGEANTNVTGGTTPYLISWLNVNGNPTTNAVTNLCADTFFVAVTDNNNCTDTANVIITQPLDSITISLTDTVFNQCFGECEGEATVLATGGTGLLSYFWINVPGNPITPNVTNLCGDVYQVRVTDANGCRDTLDIEIPSLGLLTGNVVKTDVSCGSACDGSATVVQTGGVRPYSYDWYDLPGGSSDSSLTGLCAGVYNVKITDANGCLDTVEVTIIEPPTLSLNLNTINNIACKGECNGSVTVTRTGGTAPYNFSWYDTPGNPTTLNYNLFCAGTYNLAVEDGINCKDTLQITITEPALELSSSIIDSLDLRCFGVCAGEAEVLAIGGTSPYSYRWYNAGDQTASSVNNLCAGVSFVEVTDFNGCKDTSSVLLTQPPTHVQANIIDSLDLTCFGVCIGSATVSYSGGIAPYTVDWYNFGNASTDQISNICAGTYFVRVLDDNQCADTVSVTISQPTQLNVFNTSRLPTCNNDCDGTLSVVPFGGIGPYSLQWLNIPGNPTTASIPNLCAGNYTLSITDDSLCNRVLNVPLINPSNLSISISSVTDVLCKGECSGSATVRGNGGLTPYSFSWINSPDLGTDSTENNLCVGTYDVLMTDSNGCSTTRMVTINEPVDFLSGQQIAMDSTVCFYSNDGEAEVVGLGGTAPYAYSWFTANNQVGARADSLIVGSYLVEITDFNGCKDTISANVLGPDTLQVNASIRHISCNSTNDGNIKLNPTGGYPPYNFNWLNLGNINTDSVFNLTAGMYQVELTDANNCIDTFEFEIIQTTQVFGVIDNTTNLSCYNLCNGSATVSGTGGLGTYFYDWYDAPNTPSTPTANNLCAGTYNVRVYDVAQCDDTLTITLTQPQPIVYQKDSTMATCNGICDATAELNFVSGEAPLSLVWLNVPGNPSTNSVSNVCFGTLLVQLRDGNNCLDTATIIIDAPTVVEAIITDSLDNLCISDCNGMAKVTSTGGTLPYTYLWNTLAADSINDEINNLCNGVYTVMVTDDNGCIDIKSVTINSPDTLQTNFTMYEVSCFGGSNGKIKLNPNGGQAPYSFDWYDLGNLTTDSVSDLSIGTYGVVVSDFNGCTDSLQITVTQIPTLQAQVLNNIPNVCYKDNFAEVDLGAIGGTAPYVFKWFTITGEPTGASRTNLNSGNYQVALEDALGCTDTISFAVSPPDSIQYQVNLNGISCFGQCDAEITVNVSGGVAPYNFNWYQLPGTPTTNVLQNLCVGTYRMQVIDSNGCKDTLVYNLTGPASLVVDAKGTDLTCNNDNSGVVWADITGGTLPYSILWNDINASTTDTVNNLSIGEYKVVVTDANNCLTSDSIEIFEPTILQASISDTTMAVCSCNGSASVSAQGGTGPYTYLWSDIAAQTTAIANNLCATTYSALVTDANLCSTSVNVTITDTSNFAVNLVNQNNASCFGSCDGSITVEAINSLAPITYQWDDASNTVGATVNNLCAGTYFVQVTDANNCIRIESYTITQPDSLQVNFTAQNVSCFGGSDGEIIAVVSGGVGPYTHSWSNGLLNDTIQNLTIGTYTDTIRDFNNCTLVASDQITQPLPLVNNFNKRDVSCFGASTGMVQSLVSGGLAPYEYSWNGGLYSTVDSVSSIPAGKYVLNIRDASGCLFADSIDVIQASPIVINFVSDTLQVSCTCDAVATPLVSGGLYPYVYQWNDITNQTDSVALNLCAGNYNLTVTDANNCIVSAPVVVEDLTSFRVDITNLQNETCVDLCNGVITLNPVNGNAPYTFTFNDPLNSTTSTVTNLCAGNYQAIVQDISNCTQVVNFTIAPAVPIQTNLIAQNVNCNNLCDGNIKAEVSGGNGIYTYLWDNDLNSTTDSIFNLCPRDYQVIVTDGNNCKDTVSVGIVEPSELSVSIQNIIPVVCFGDSTGSISLNVSGGNLPYSFAWNHGETVKDIENKVAGNYFITVTDAKNCMDTISASITQNQKLEAIVTDSILVDCGGQNTGSITIGVTGGVYPYSYTWLGNLVSTNDSVQNNLTNGVYTVIVKDAVDCVDSVRVNLVTSPSALQIVNVNIQNTTCNTCNGSIVAQVSGGTAPYTYSWTNTISVNNPQIENLCVGTYTFTVQDDLGCVVDSIINVGVIDSLEINARIVNSNINICFGSSSAFAVVDYNRTAAPYTVQWNDPLLQTTDTAYNLSVGTYQVIVTNIGGCKDTVDLNVQQGTQIILDSISSSLTSCSGICDASAVFTATGGVGSLNVLWDNGSTILNPSNLCEGLNTITVTDDLGCSVTDSVLINVNNPILANNNVTNVLCFGDCNGSAEVLVTGGGLAPYRHSWSNGASTNLVNSLCAGNYTDTVYDFNNCFIVQNIQITQPLQLISSAIDTARVTCYNDCDGEAKVSVVGGTLPYQFNWDNATTDSVAINLCPGSYIVQIKDLNNCIVTDTVEVLNVDSIKIQTSNIQNPICYNNCDGFIALTIEGGNGDYAYTWLDNQITDSIANLCAGNYQVLVQDKLLCSNTFDFTVTQPDSINLQLVNAQEITCIGTNTAQITVNATGGTGILSYLWNDVLATTSAILNNVDTGSFEVVVTDANNCTKSLTTVLTDTLVMKLEIDSTVLKCFELCEGTITPKVSGGVYPYDFNWSNASNDSVLTNLCANTFTLTLVDNQNCTIVKSVDITQPNELIVSVLQEKNVSCANVCDGKVLIEAQGGVGNYEFKWNNVIGVDSIVNLCANTYSLELRDSNNCLVQQDFIITEPDAISLSVNSTNSTCNDSKDGEANVVATGGTGVLNVRWFNNKTFEQFGFTVNTLDTGKYYVNVLDDNACSVLDSVDIIAVNDVKAIVVSDTTICYGDTLNLSASGGDTYVWSNGENTSTIQLLPTQNATVTVTAISNSCSAIANVNIFVNPLPSFIINASNTVLLKGKTAILNVNPSPNEWVYNWNPPIGLSDPTIANPIANPSDSQLYTLQVTNENGCSDTASIRMIVTESIIIPDAITPNNDGYNDIWRIDLIEEFPQSVVEVYNRWGQLVFRSVGYTEKFNGTHNGKDLPVGTYYYVIDLGADMPKYTGPITIMR
jgi:gliding motility-associated-like protein